MTKAVQMSDKAHAMLKEAAFNHQTSMAKFIHKMLQDLDKKDNDNVVNNDLSEVIEKIDLIIEQTKPKTRAKKSVVKVEQKCSFQQKLIDYRKEIKKPIKTERGLNQLVSAIEACAMVWRVDRDDVLDYMASKEWQSIKPDYDNPFVKKMASHGVANNQSIDDILG